MKIAIYICVVMLILMSGIWWSIYKYNDCIKVGHSKLYCILDSGK